MDDGMVATITVLVYFALVSFARVSLIRDPFRLGLVADLDLLVDRLSEVQGPTAVNWRTRLTDARDGLTLRRPWVWRGARDYQALHLVREARIWLAGIGSDSAVGGRAFVAANRLPKDAAWLKDDLTGLRQKSPLTDGDRDLVRTATRLEDDSVERIGYQLQLHRKSFWIIATAALLISVLSLTLGNPVLFAMGALGAFVSRLIAVVRAKSIPTDYPFHWTTIMLGPLLGAMAAYGGLLLIELLKALEVLGESFDKVSWDSAAPVTLAVAFLLGFSERLLDTIAARATAPFESDQAAGAGGGGDGDEEGGQGGGPGSGAAAGGDPVLAEEVEEVEQDAEAAAPDAVGDEGAGRDVDDAAGVVLEEDADEERVQVDEGADGTEEE